MGTKYEFKIYEDEDDDIVILTVKGFKNGTERAEFADDLHYTLSEKNLELFSLKEGSYEKLFASNEIDPTKKILH